MGMQADGRPGIGMCGKLNPRKNDRCELEVGHKGKHFNGGTEFWEQGTEGEEPKPTLVLTIGLPRSGKSSWAVRTGFPVVNPDSIRYALHGQRFLWEAEPMVWTMARYMVRSLFLTGHRIVILDATNIKVHRREEWQSEQWETYYKQFKTPAEECIRRALALEDQYIVPIIERMAAEFEPLTEEEAWRLFK
jgi:predicted kinase